MVNRKIESRGDAERSHTPPGAMPVSPRQFIRLSGFALFLGAVLWGVGETSWGLFVLGASDPSEYPQPTATILWLVVLVGFILILLALPGLHAAQARRTRTFGLIAFLVLFVGEALMMGIANFGAFYQAGLTSLIVDAEAAGVSTEEPVMAIVGYLGAYGFHILGWILFGVAALRAKVLPRWPVVLAMVVPLFMLVASATLVAAGDTPPALLIPLPMAWAVGIAWLGVALIRLAREDERNAGETGAPDSQELARS